MSQLMAFFEIPLEIRAGLDSGIYKRTGGVIQEVFTGKIRTWLRETGMVDITKSLEGITSLAQFATGASLLSLGLTSVTLAVVVHRFNQIDKKLDNLSELVKSEFKKDRRYAFNTALQRAKDAFEGQNVNRTQSLGVAAGELYTSRIQLVDEFKIYFDQSDKSLDYLRLAQDSLVLAMYAVISRTRCIIDYDQNLGKKRISEEVPEFRELTASLVNRWLGEMSTIYFHKDVDNETLDRFLKVQHWLRRQSQPAWQDLAILIHELRADFWNVEAITPKYDSVQDRVRNLNRARTVESVLPDLQERLLQAELMIENYQRLEGYELELRSINLSFEEWENLVSAEDIEKNGGLAVIIDEEFLARLS